MSPFPERALAAADSLRDLARDEGHLHHMPAHIYVLCGDYAQAVAVSERAVRADDSYLAYAGAEPVASIWKGTRWSTTWKNVFDGLVYALLTGGVFGWLWP